MQTLDQSVSTMQPGTHIAGVGGVMMMVMRLITRPVAGLQVAPGVLTEARLNGHHVALGGEDVAALGVVQRVVLVKELNNRGHRTENSFTADTSTCTHQSFIHSFIHSQPDIHMYTSVIHSFTA